MKNDPKNIEERIIPYIEGVLNSQEHEEVRDAVNADPELQREVLELKGVIDDLRAAFASGVKPPQADLTPEEVSLLSEHTGGVDSMPGSSDQKARLFLSDQALEEYEMLRALQADMRKEVFRPDEDIPEMPESLLQEIRALDTGKGKVIPFSAAGKASVWKRATSWLDSLDARRLTATAAAFVLVSFGVHFYTNSNPAPTKSASTEVAYGRAGEQAPPSPAAVEPQSAEIAEPEAGSREAQEPSGVAVFTSSDRGLLKEQAEKLMANGVRYTVTGDKILVSEKQVGSAREVLWGKEDSETVAMAEKPSNERLRPEPNFQSRPASDGPERAARPKRMSEISPYQRGAGSAPGRAAAKGSPNAYQSQEDSGSDEGPELKIRIYDGVKEEKNKEVPSYDPKGKLGQAQAKKKDTAENFKESENSALTRAESPAVVGSVATAEKEPEVREEASSSGDDDETGSESRTTDPAELRRQKLRDLALGKAQQQRAEESDKDGTEKFKVTRSRVAAEPPVQERPSPVANVLTSDQVAKPSPPNRPAEASGGAVAKVESGRPPGAEWENLPEVSRPPAKPSRPSQEEGNRAPSASSSSPAPSAGSVSDADFRVAGIRNSQAAVARRYNVVLSVENRGSKINVYVRPKKELSKAEIDSLRKAIRSELGLAPQDSIIFR